MTRRKHTAAGRWVKVITDANAPDRLKGKTVTVTCRGGAIDFKIDMPEDATKNEIAYFRLVAAEVCDRLESKGFTATLGQACRGDGHCPTPVPSPGQE